MHARLGHAQDLEKLFAEIGNRSMSGPATEMLTGAREGLWMFRNEPGISYLCGPMALKNVLIALKADPAKVALMDQQRSGPRGFNLEQVAQLAEKAGLSYRLVYRSPGQPIPVPSIVNWKLHHYAAIVGEQDGRYHLKDPTFASGDAWVTTAAIDAESSGYFLVPTQEQPEAPWRTASLEEAREVYGMGFTNQNQPGATTPGDNSLRNDPNCGMCGADAKLMVVSLNLNDSPVGYQPPLGPSPRIRLTYNQREAGQPAVFSFFNVSPKWTLNVLSWVQDNPASPGLSVFRYVAGGGSIDYSSGYTYNFSTGAFSPGRQDQEVLVRIPATGPVTSYELRLPDGSKQIFAQADGATSYPRRMFLSQIVDSAGNALKLSYDNQSRLTSLKDATGRDTSFSYGLPANPLLVTQITDPFGRHADLTYDASGRLSSITDVLGLTSSFSYDAGGLVNAMTTPYGNSRFTYGEDSYYNTRYLEMTDPLGQTERLEFRHSAPGMPYSDPIAPTGLSYFNVYLFYRNTFYWDKNTYPVTHTDYAKAQITHWLHNSVGQTSPIVESTKLPLERRVWRTYPGQSYTYYEGNMGVPAIIARVLDDGTTQATTLTYNTLGRPLTITDPQGRVTRFTYAANDIDVLTVEQKTNASGYATIATLTYNSQHRPLTYRDAAGKTWTFTYNGAGQLTSKKDPLNQTTSYQYDSLGYLTRIVNADGQMAASFTYDGFGRVATRTDSEGHTVSFNYDVFDRITKADFPDGTSYRYAWDKLDLASVTDRLGRVTRFTYDAVRQLTSVTDSLGQVTRYSYYPNGTLKTLTDAKGNVTQWERDLQSRVTAKTYADGSDLTYAYEATTSRLKALTDALGQTKSFTYTIDDRLASLAYANARQATPGVSFTWDAFFPRLVSMTDGIGTTNFQYGPVGSQGALQLASENGPYNNDTIAYQYDALGRVVGRTVDNATDNVTYDALGRGVSRSNPLGSFTYDYLGETGQPVSLAMAGGPIQTQWNYEANRDDRRLKSIISSGVARRFDYATRPENLIDQIVETSGATLTTWDYDYDAADRLTAATSATARYSYTYDSAGNITGIQLPSGGKSLSYNNINQLTQVSGATYRHDANGNLIEDDQRTYQWDAENRLVSIGYKANSTQKTDFRYDGLGRRIAIIDKSAANTTETRYLWCGDTLCQARTAADVVSRRYYPEGEVWPQGGTRLFYARDHLGSVRDVLAAPTGGKVAGYDYDAYGNSTQTSGRVGVDFRYAGMFYHPQSGLYLTHFRAYDPRTGRWLSRDPIEEQGGINLYGYVFNNPVNLVDSTGKAVDIFLDIGFIGYDLYRLLSDGECGSEENLTALYADLAGAIIPGATGLGFATRIAKIGKSVEKTVVRTTRSGEKGVRIIRKDGSVIDITEKRVKEYVPNSHPSAPPGTLDKVKFPNPQPGSKGYKRDPTPEEINILRDIE